MQIFFSTRRSRSRRLLRPLVALLLLSAVVACEQKSPAPVHQPILFSQAPALKLNVAKIDIVETYVPPLKSPHVEHFFPKPPAAVVRAWAAEKLRPVGGSGSAVLTITNAAVVAEILKVKTGLKGLVTRDQAKRYTATVRVQIHLRSGNGLERGTAAVKFQISQTAPEDLSLNDRERMFHAMAQEIASNFDGLMREAMAKHLASFLR